MRRVGVDAVDGVDVGVGAGVEGEVDRGYVGRYRAGHQVAPLQAPVAAVDAKAHDVALLWQLATEAVTFTARYRFSSISPPARLRDITISATTLLHLNLSLSKSLLV